MQIAAACAVTKASGNGVDSCCIAWLSSERRVWVGTSCAIVRQHGQRRLRRGRTRQDRRSEVADEQDLRGFERLVGVLPDPKAFGIGAAEAFRHGGAQRAGGDWIAVFKRWQKETCRLKDGVGAIELDGSGRGMRRDGLGGRRCRS